MSPTICITGATGMLGTSLRKLFPQATLLSGRQEVDLTNLTDTRTYFKNKFFDIIIHTAAFTNLNYCEKNPVITKSLHSSVVSLLRLHCRKLIYISTVPLESSKVYFITKRSGEEETLKNPNNLVIRTNIYGSGGLVQWAVANLIKKTPINGYTNVKFNAVHVDQLSYTMRDNLLSASGTVNVGGDFSISKYDFLCLVAQALNLNDDLISPIIAPNEPSLIVPLEDHHYAHSLSKGLKCLK